MKEKITPEEYKTILDSIEIDQISIIESKSKYDKSKLTNNLDLVIKEKQEFSQDELGLNIKYKFVLKGQSADLDKAAVEISATYQMVYLKKNKIEIDSNFYEPFTKFVLSLMIWTYFREYVQNMVYRMNLPPLVLPLKRV